MDKLLLIDLLSSWVTYSDTIYRTEDILDWINEKNTTTRVDIVRNHLSDSEHWFYDKGTGKIIHKDGGFFSIAGIEHKSSDGILYSQPILIQDEIGYLGIIAKKIDGILYFLMQAKIEPGNINKIQISPTIQATRSNFTQIHGGKKPLYLDYFLNASPDKIIVDQLQSEQSSRFLKKRNRNICILLNENEDIEVSPNHRWLTLGQIKALMKIDNIVNMDTRTVLSCLPFHALPGTGDEEFKPFFAEEALYRSVFSGAEDYPIIYSRINNRKMFDNSHTSIVRLDELGDWEMDDDGIRSTRSADFDVIYCQIEIENREVVNWTQPLFRAKGIAVFGLLTAVIGGRYKFLVRLTEETGSFDILELGPTIQMEFTRLNNAKDEVQKLFFEKLSATQDILYDVILSEEGGRFYHEQNRNVIIKVAQGDIVLTDDYLWMDFGQLNRLVQFNNVLNIQLRNLLSLIQITPEKV